MASVFVRGRECREAGMRAKPWEDFSEAVSHVPPLYTNSSGKPSQTIDAGEIKNKRVSKYTAEFLELIGNSALRSIS